MMRRLSKPLIFLFICVSSLLAENPTTYQIHGQAWTESGRIMKSSDTLGTTSRKIESLDLSGNWLQSAGAQFTAIADLGSNLEGAFGFGAIRATQSLGQGQFSYLAISLFQNFITQARLTYFQGDRDAPWLSISMGNFHYNYNPDVKNLGAYLLRGPVYPGILSSGFQHASIDSTRSNILGLRLHHAMGIFSHDVIIKNEFDIPPTLDWSVAYVAKLKLGSFEFGGGANFYRAIAYNKELETPGHLPDSLLFGAKRFRFIDLGDSISSDTVTDAFGNTTITVNYKDSVFYTHQGIKLMAMFSLDLKPLFNSSSKNPDDLKLYGEGAVIGLKNYGKAYNDIARRIPLMVGFNFPTFGWFDHVSLEFEYYRSLYRPDLANVGNVDIIADWTREERPQPSPKPVTYADYGIDPLGNWIKPNGIDTVMNVLGTTMDVEHLTQDDLKWSVFIDKTVQKHLIFTAQIASDHYRPRSVATGLIFGDAGTAEAFSALSDWYFMLRMGYRF